MKNKKGYIQIIAIVVVFIFLIIAFNGVKTNVSNMDMLETQVLNSNPFYDSPTLLIKVTNLLIDDSNFEIKINYDNNEMSTDNYYIERGRDIEMSGLDRNDIKTYSITFNPIKEDFWNNTQYVEVSLIYKNKVIQSEKVYLNKISLIQKWRNLL